MGRVKWDNINGIGVPAATGEGQRYTGPDVPKGSYVARVKRATLESIKSAGENQGKPRINILLEIVGGAGSKQIPDPKFKYYGAPVWDGLNIIQSSVAFVNAFLHGIVGRDSDQARRAIETAFWDNGCTVKSVKVEKGARQGQIDKHVIKIGNIKLDSPNGQVLVQITTKAGTNIKTGEYQPNVSGYMPYTGERAKSDEEEDTDADIDDDDLDDVDDDDDDDDDDVDADEDDDEDDDDDSADDGEPVSVGATAYDDGPPF